jgi:hypothetical protein
MNRKSQNTRYYNNMQNKMPQYIESFDFEENVCVTKAPSI